ncbi:hypothetical protein CJ030_MR8G006648 [Morella rubra]|uniref:Putative plant transposon protein domain-containing protein n=1 Tax=Morella rubra TaxID=262757 RepID=A0A6A1UWL6_9ROSI|nr:hypothetical protein CJ030_MR8G006648 [Morella rubra]
MSFNLPTRSSQRTPVSVCSKGKKKAKTSEEPHPTPEEYIYRMSEVDPIHILRVVLDNPTLDEVIRPTAGDLSIPRRLLHHMVCNIILPRMGKFEYITFLDLFVMYCLITHMPMNVGHLMVNHMKAATEKKKQGLPYGMFFTHLFQILDVDLTREVREPPKASKEYNQKTLKLMGFIQNEEGFWIKKTDVTP